MPTLYLIDGYAQFFRAYHAIRTPMTSPVTKEPTNMSFGFIGMMLKLLRGEGNLGGRPDYIALALDVSGDKETFRSEIYPEYKANRPPPPEDLFPQVERCLDTLRKIGVPIVGMEGFEADDVIATVVDKLTAQHPDLRIRIVSKDKDLKQLLCGTPSPAGTPAKSAAGGVELFDVHTDTPITVATLQAETGLAPTQVVDMLSLMGDSVDNVPGVEGVGEKTAAQLIRQYGSLDNLLAHANEVPGKRGEKLRAASGVLDLSRRLIVLRRDVPIDLDLSKASVGSMQLEALMPVLRELGFNRYQDELRALTRAPGDAEGMAPLRPPGWSGPVGGNVVRAPTPPPSKPPAGQGSLFGAGRGTGGAGALGGAGGGSAGIDTRRAPEGGPAESPRGSVETIAPAAPIGDQGQLFSAPQIAARVRSTHTDSADYTCVRTKEELAALVEELRAAPLISLDTETTSLAPMRARLCGLCFSTRPGTGRYVPVRSPEAASHLNEATVMAALGPLLEDPHKAKCGHNLKYDSLILRRSGVTLRGAYPLAAPLAEDAGSGSFMREASDFAGGDSMIASYLIDASRSSHSLDALAMAILKRENIHISDLLGPREASNQRSFETVPLDAATIYAAEDADVALQLVEAMRPQLRAMGLAPLMDDVEMPLVDVLAELEFNGILVEPSELERQRARLQGRIDELLGEIHKEGVRALGRRFDPDSPKQLAAALFNKNDDEVPGLGIKPIKRTKTGYSTDAEVLEKIAEDATLATPIPRLILEYRQLTKLVSTYLVALKDAIDPDTKRIHASFNQTVAATGRLASSDPNLQNVPIRTDIGREIRRAFIAPPGHVLLTADYSQIELRLLAHLSRDPALIEAFHRGEDIHTQVAAQIHGVPLDKVTKEQRSGAKMVNFGIVYGITSFGLARRLAVSNEAASQIITGYKKRFSGITTFLQECVEQARRYGYVETMLKRRRPILDIDSNNPSRRALAERTAINTVVQGSAADLIKLAMVDVHRRIVAAREAAEGAVPPALRPLRGVKMLLQIHDELVFEAPEGVAEEARRVIVERMERAMTVSVPLKVDSHVGRNWHEGK